MHLGNGAITTECAWISGAVAVGGLSALRWAPKRTESPKAPAGLAAAAVALVFAAQMFNVSILGVSSVHFVGATWLAWTFGPRVGVWLATLVLGAQACLLGDGGLAALGANVVNMAVLPALIVASVQGSRLGRQPMAAELLMAATAWTSVLVGALLVVVETGLGRGSVDGDWGAFARDMVTTHATAGVLEALATVALVKAYAALHDGRSSVASPRRRVIDIAAVALGCGVAALATIAASSAPDGFEFAAQSNGLGWLLAETTSVWLARGQQTCVSVAQALAGSETILAATATFAIALAAGGLVGERSPQTKPSGG